MRKIVNSLALAVAGVALCHASVNAQLSLSWEEIGPNNQGNHFRAIAVDGSGNVFAGSVGGGLWKSTDKGSSWSQVSGISENLAVSSIAIQGSKIYVGTGENVFYEPSSSLISPWSHDSVTTFKYGFFGYTGQPGAGVFVSTDGGANFTHNNGTWGPSSTPYSGPFKSIQSIATNGNRVFVAALDGLYWSDNDLSTVTKSTGTTRFTTTPIHDVTVCAGNVVLAATKDSVYRSTNNGASFGSAINTSIFTGGTAPNNRVGGARIKLVTAPSDPNTVYVTGASDINGNCTGVWKSTDAGSTWSRVCPYESGAFRPFNGRGKYNLVLAVHPKDANALVLGGNTTYKYSETTGWINSGSHVFIPGFSTNYVPRPQLVIAIDPSSDSTYYVGGDAEVVRTDNFGTSFSFKTKGLNAAHLNGIDGSVNFEVIASDRFRGLLYKDNGNSAPSLQQFSDVNINSEGGIARYSPHRPEVLVSQGPDGGLERSFDGGGTWEPFYGVPVEPFHPSIASQDSLYIDRADTSSSGGTLYDVGGAPVTPWCFDEYIDPARFSNDSLITNSPAVLYMCSKSFVWTVTNPYGGIDSLPRWNRITNDLSRGSFAGGKKEYFTAMACSNDANHNLYVATNGGRIFRINGANDPTTLDIVNDVVQIDDATMPRGWVSDIAINPNNPSIIVVTYGGYASIGDRVWITNNATDAVPTWRAIQNGIPAGLPVYTAAFTNDATDRALLVGTESGLYASSSDYTNNSASISFSNMSGAIGTAAVTDIVFRKYNLVYTNGDHYKYDPDNTILVATHGRGAYKSRSLVSTPERNDIGAAGIRIGVSPNPATTRTQIEIELPSAAQVVLEAFDINGRPVAKLADRKYSAGVAQVGFETGNLSAGMYLVKASITTATGSYQHTERVAVVK